MKDYKTGIVTCQICGAVLGNYQTGDFYRLIRLKYCPECKEEVDREMKRKAAKRYRQRRREYHSQIEERARILEAENEALRLKVFGAKDAAQSQKIINFFQGLAHE